MFANLIHASPIIIATIVFVGIGIVVVKQYEREQKEKAQKLHPHTPA